MKSVTFLFVASFGLGVGMAAAEETDVGKVLYDQYCSACHGFSGKGGGELTEILTVQVPQLTGLAKANDGEFPMLRVIHVIDGRSGLRAHMGPMPIFGEMFMSDAEEKLMGAVIETRGRILSIATYLESIQE
ncbi:c-type cytochrome [Frigidibacter sp. RF13]|uniref:c-type cytochrome n=1 Tax=Frigidibacter sp. RF13 TaxID=2997340 RepID=UPI002270297B|nr:c-type cytochrome [Frigidibacter sp. RF13]MCY1128754.1 c-type cytochrome [Frigidibacter sp. RF13]